MTFAALYIIVVLGVIALYFLLMFLYKPIGRLFQKLFSDYNKILNDEDEREEK